MTFNTVFPPPKNPKVTTESRTLPYINTKFTRRSSSSLTQKRKRGSPNSDCFRKEGAYRGHVQQSPDDRQQGTPAKSTNMRRASDTSHVPENLLVRRGGLQLPLECKLPRRERGGKSDCQIFPFSSMHRRQVARVKI